MFINNRSEGAPNSKDNQMRKILSATAAITMGMALAACGSTASSSSGGDDVAGVADAKSYLDPKLETPTSINIDEPLSKKPEAGKVIVGLNSGIPSANVLAAAWKQAA